MSAPDETYDELKEDYFSLAEEMSAGDVTWNEEDWDVGAVANAKKYARNHGLPWPPRSNTFDLLYDIEHNPSDYPDIKL